jgi:hypothetical protein
MEISKASATADKSNRETRRDFVRSASAGFENCFIRNRRSLRFAAENIV